jgi:hypothetical protein
VYRPKFGGRDNPEENDRAIRQAFRQTRPLAVRSMFLTENNKGNDTESVVLFETMPVFDMGQQRYSKRICDKDGRIGFCA